MFFLKGKFFPLMVLVLSIAFIPTFTQAKTIDLGTASDTVRIPGQLLNTSLSGTGNRCLYVDSSGNLSVKGFDCGSATGGDDMGSHSATQNIRLNSFWLSGDGGNEGVYVTSVGNVGVGVSSPGARLQVSAPTGSEGLRIVSASDWSPLNIRNSSNTADIFRVDQSGVLQVGQIPFARVTGFSYTETDPNVYAWAKAASKPSYAFTEISGTVTDAQVPNNITIDNATNAANLTGALNWTQLQTYPTPCSAGQFVSAVGDTLTCSTPAGGISGSGTASYLPRWTGTSSLGNSLIYDNGSNVGISATSLGYKLTVNGTIGTPDTNNPYLVLDSSSSGGNNAEQSAQISLGESGRGAAALHLAYTGDGYSYIGMGDLGADNIPDYYAMRLYYGNNKVYMPGQLGIGADASSYKLYVNGDSYFSNPIVTVSPTAASHVATKNYVDSIVIPWSRITSFPSACPAGQYVTAIGGTLTCAAPPGGLSGSGTANYISKWTGTSSLSNSIIYDNGTNLGIGNTSPEARVQINAGTGEALRLVTHASYSPLNIRNSSNTADIFRVDQSGVLRVGQIPFAQVTGFSYSETDPNVSAWAKAVSKPSYAFTEISGTVTDAQVPNNITIDNANAVDGQSFTWSNTSNSPTYLWATNSNGTSFLAARASISVNYATSAGSASTATTATTARSADRLAANGANCSAGYYPLGVDASGAVESCTLVPTGSDIYWTGTATNLNPATGRSSLGLGSLATLNSVTTTYISNGTILNEDISSSAAIHASKINFGTGTSGQVWTSDGSTGGRWQTASMPTGTSNSTLRYTSLTGWVSSPLLNNDGSSVNINYNFTNTCTNTKLGVNGAINANSLYLSNIINGYCAAGANIAYDSASSVLNFSGAVNAYYFNAPVRPLDGSAASPTFTFNNDTDTGIYRSTTNTMDFATAGARRVTIDSNGNVGINVSPPTQRLDVNGYAKATGFCIGASCITSWPSGGGLSGSGTSGYIGKWSGSTSLNNSVIYQNGTNIGISTTNPGTYKLYISGNAYVNGSMTATSFLYSSDLRLKDNVKTIDQALAKVLSLRGVSFNWRNNGNLNLGLIAQEVEQVFPELVVEQDGYKAVQYGNLVAPLIEAIKEQQQQIMDLNQRISQLEMMNK